MKKGKSTALVVRLCTIGLALLLGTVGLLGCSTTGTTAGTAAQTTAAGTSKATAGASSAATTPEEGGLPAPGELPLVTDGTTLTFGLSQHALTTDYKDNDFTKLLEDVTGVNLDFELLPTDGTEAKQKFSLMVSANQTLPDIVIMGFSDKERFDYGSTGKLIALNDYFETEAFYFYETLNKWASDKEISDLMKYGASPDGNIYAYPSYYIDPGDSSATGMWMNKKWLDTLGKEVPKTTDDLYDVLKAFNANDANENGKSDDEVPLIGHIDWAGSVTTYLMNSFIYNNGVGLNAENGKIYAPYATDEWREGLRYMFMLADEGLLSPLSFSQTQNELRAILSDPSDDPSIIGAFVGHPSPLFGTDGAPRVMEYMALPAMVGPEGVNWSANSGWFGAYNTQITSSCANPELAFRVMDAVSREDMSLAMRNGVQGLDWDYTTEGSPNHVIPGYEVVFQSMATDTRVSRWTSENNTIWHINAMNQLPPKLFGGLKMSDYPNEYRKYQMRDLWYETVPLRYDNHPEELVNRLIYTAEELEKINEIQTTINSYVDESKTRFILGEINIETEWDSYVSTLESMGLATLLETAQVCYDRMNAN